MSKSQQTETRPPEAVQSLTQFFSASEARVDRWRTLNRLARALAAAATPQVEHLRADATAALAELAPIEDLNGYPGPHLMAQVHERLSTGDWTGLARLVQRISIALLSNSYREDKEAWTTDDETEAHLPDILPPSVGRGQTRKPYFEVLIVAAGERATWPVLRETFKRLRR
ncbi:MAG: hypothetical protein ACM338_13660, partial [Betaproteobacteria bacterium]